MRTRTIVVLVVAGVALLAIGLEGRSGPAPPPAIDAPMSDAVPDNALRETLNTATSSTSTTTSSTTIAGAGSVEGVDRLQRAQPLTQRLPYDAPHFRVDYRVGAAGELTVQITLKAVLNRPDQLQAYRADLRAYKAEATEWLRSAGADPGALSIEWRPPEAAAL